MGRCLLGVLILTAGLAALASAAKETRSSVAETTTTKKDNPRATQAVAASGALRTLLLPAPAFDIRFSLN